MDYIIHMYDSNQYESYELALPDGATYSTSNYITLDTEDDILTITDVLHTAMGCIGIAPDSVRLGILKQDVFVPLQDVHDVLIRGHTSIVVHAIDFAYQALANVTVTLTRAEVIELTHRINMESSRFTAAYAKSGYNPLDITAKSKLYAKLNKISKALG